MRALVRYLGLKTVRERFILPIILTPLVLVAGPVAGLIVRALVTGKPVYPFHFATDTPEKTMAILAGIGGTFSALMGGIAAFWIFRQEIASRSIAAIILATRPLKVSAAAILYGVITATVSFFLSLSVLCVLTLSVPLGTRTLFLGVLAGALVASVVGVASSAISPDPGMLLPMGAVALPFIVAMQHPGATSMKIAAGVVLTFPLLASWFLERRCAG